MTRYEQGFMRKCAEYGVDGRALLEKLAGPRPEERKAIQRITANPATLKALTTPEAAPPRTDDPVWNPANVQKWVTSTATAPVWVPQIPRLADKVIDKVMSTPVGTAIEHTGYKGRGVAYEVPLELGDTAAGSLVGLGGAFGGIGAYMSKLMNMVNRRRLSAAQRKADAKAILSGNTPGPAFWHGNDSTDKALEAAGGNVLQF